jgi:nicotinamidase-related amidase
MDRTALIVVDVQRGFDDAGFFGPRNNTACEENVRALIAAWRRSNQPIVFVRHHWDEDGSPLRSDEPGSEFKDVIEGEPDLLVSKRVNSAFHGARLHDWLRKDEIDKLASAASEKCAA